MIDCSGPSRNAEDGGLEGDVQGREGSDGPDGKRSERTLCVGHSQGLKLTTNTDELVEERECLKTSMDGNVRTETCVHNSCGVSTHNAQVNIDRASNISTRECLNMASDVKTERLCDESVGVNANSASVSTDTGQSTSTRAAAVCVSEAEDNASRPQEMDGGLALNCEAKSLRSMRGAQTTEKTARQTEGRLSGRNDTKRKVLEHNAEDDGVRLNEDQKIREKGGGTDVIAESTEKDAKSGASMKRRASRKCNIQRFMKTQKTQGRKAGLRKDGKFRKHSSNQGKATEDHLCKTKDLDLICDEKLRKKVQVVIRKESLQTMIAKAKEQLGIRVNLPKMQKVKNSLLDTKKLRDLFSLKDSSKPDMIKPSLLKRRRQECVTVCPVSVEKEEARVTPDLLRGVGRRGTGRGSEASCLVKHSQNGVSNDKMKRKTTPAPDEKCFLSPKREKKECRVKISLRGTSRNTVESRLQNHDKNRRLPSPEQSKEPKDKGVCCAAEQTRSEPDDGLLSAGKQQSGLKKDRRPNPKQTCKLTPKRQLMLQSSEGDSKHTAARGAATQRRREEHGTDGGRRSGKKRKLQCEQTEPVENVRPRKTRRLTKKQSTEEAVGDSSKETKEASPALASRSLASPEACSVSGGETGGEANSVKPKVAIGRGESHIPSCEKEDKAKQQLQVSKVKDVHPPQQHKSSSCEHHEAASHCKSDGSTQRNGCAGKFNKSKLILDHNHNVYSPESEHFESASVGNILEQDSAGKLQTAVVGTGNVAGKRKPQGEASSALASQCRSAVQSQPAEPQSSLAGNAAPLPAAGEAQPSAKQKSASARRNIPDVSQGEGNTGDGDTSVGEDPAGSTGLKRRGGSKERQECAGGAGEGGNTQQSEGNVAEDPVGLHHKCNIGVKKCAKAESQECASACDSPSAHGASSEASPDKISSSQGEQCVAGSEQDSAGDTLPSGAVTGVLQPPGNDSLSSKESEHSEKKRSPEAAQTGTVETSQSSVPDLPSPAVVANRIESTIRHYMLRVHVNLSLEDLYTKHECLPLTQASVDFFCNAATQQPDQPAALKPLFSGRKLPGVRKIVLERILTKMKLQLLSDANKVSDTSRCLASGGLETLTSFVEGQVASPPRVTGAPRAQQRTELEEGVHLSLHLAKSFITERLAALHRPYWVSSAQPLHATMHRTHADSGLCTGKIAQDPRHQEICIKSPPAAGSLPLDTGQNCSLAPLRTGLPQGTPFPAGACGSIPAQPGHTTNTLRGIGKAVFVPNELYQPVWDNLPHQAPLDWKQDCKYIHLFQGGQEEITKLKCLLVAHKKCYGTLRDVEVHGGHVLAHHTVLDKLLASPELPQLCASSCVRFGVYGSLTHVLEGRVVAVLAERRLLLLLHHTALLDPNTGAVLQCVSSSSLHLALVPVHTLHTCVCLLSRQSRTSTEEKLKEVLKRNLQHFMKCVEAGVGHILGGSKGSTCAALSPESPITEYHACLALVHHSLDFAHRYTTVLIGEGVKKAANSQQPPVYQLCSASEVLQQFLKVDSMKESK